MKVPQSMMMSLKVGWVGESCVALESSKKDEVWEAVRHPKAVAWAARRSFVVCGRVHEKCWSSPDATAVERSLEGT